jgi:hypothetical protein
LVLFVGTVVSVIALLLHRKEGAPFYMVDVVALLCALAAARVARCVHLLSRLVNFVASTQKKVANSPTSTTP